MTAEAERPSIARRRKTVKPRKPAPAPARAGSIEEIERGPSGKAIAAIFDFDGTLIAGYSALDMAQTRIVRGQVSAREFIGLAGLVARSAVGAANFSDLIAFTAKNWKGRLESDLMKEGENIYRLEAPRSAAPKPPQHR